MLAQFGLLMMFQFLGEALVRGCGVPFPGPLCGMALLLCYLHWRGGPPQELAAVAAVLVDNLGLLFVPAGVAIVAYGELLRRDGIAILAALILSTLATIAVTGLIATVRAPVARRGEHAA